MAKLQPDNRRILIVDDNPWIHDDFRSVLCAPEQPCAERFKSIKAQPAALQLRFHVESAYQGAQSLEMVKAAVHERKPFAMAFVDMRMPPGWTGLETIEQFWREDPDLQVVICTAFSDYSWEQILRQLGPSDRLLILKKPFDPDEVRQLALTLTTKWNLNRDYELREAELHLAVEQRTAELRTAKEVAEEASQGKTEFLANITHEILTPLNGITGMIALLEEASLDGTARSYLDIAKNSLASLQAIISDVLDISKLDCGLVELTPSNFKLRSFIETILQPFKKTAAAKGLEFSVTIDSQVPDSLFGDMNVFCQAMSNLLSNAVKFTAEGRICFTVKPERSEGTDVILRIEVADTGVGIDAAKLGRLFKSFSQVDSSMTRKYGGTGLGLVICRRLVQLMGGDVGIESQSGVGTTVWFTASFQRSIIKCSKSCG
ncbi:MAG TPA: ATP-binding protein [Tepidisphaeraceae bacterium]|nr:ATP-binding protein [Tepidisphaeraceae bacterium]